MSSAVAQSAGADVFFRSPTKVDVNLFVDVRPRCPAPSARPTNSHSAAAAGTGPLPPLLITSSPRPPPQASSPSSTKFASIDEFGSLDEAGKKLVAQYLIEFASTRIGVKREAKARLSPSLPPSHPHGHPTDP